MIVVRVELHSAVTGQVTELARMLISNKGDSPDKRIGNYRASVLRAPRFKSVTRDSSVTGYRRLSRPVWDLVALALKNAGYGR